MAVIIEMYPAENGGVQSFLKQHHSKTSKTKTTMNNKNNTTINMNAASSKYPHLVGVGAITGHFEMKRVGTKNSELIGFVTDNIKQLCPAAVSVVPVGNSFAAIAYKDKARQQMDVTTYHLTTFGATISMVNGNLTTFTMLCQNADGLTYDIEDPIFDLALTSSNLRVVAAPIPMNAPAVTLPTPPASVEIVEKPAAIPAPEAEADSNKGKATLAPYANPNKGGEVKSYKIEGDLQPILSLISKIMVGKKGKPISKLQPAFYMPISRLTKYGVEKFVSQCKKAGVELAVTLAA